MVGKEKKKKTTVKSKIALASKHSCAQLVGSVVWNYDLCRTSLDQRKTLEFGVVMIHLELSCFTALCWGRGYEPFSEVLSDRIVVSLHFP